MVLEEITVGSMLGSVIGSLFSRVEMIGVLLIAAMAFGIFIHVFRRAFLGDGVGWFEGIYEHKPDAREGFDILQRITHPLTWISIGGLMLTGTLTYTGIYTYSTTQPLHYLFAWVLIFAVVIHLAWDVLLHPSRLSDEMIWPEDIKNLIVIPLNFLGLRDDYPPQGRYGSLEKMPHVALIFLIPVMIITGLMLIGGKEFFLLGSIGSLGIFQESMEIGRAHV